MLKVFWDALVDRSVKYSFSLVMNLTVRRYSTARFGLLKAALIARSICVLSNPMLSMFAIADARSVPRAKADGSSKLPVPAAGAVEPVAAGVGVAGMLSDVGFDA